MIASHKIDVRGGEGWSDESVLPLGVIQEDELLGLKIGLASSGMEAFRLGLLPFRVSTHRAGIVVVDSNRPVSNASLRDELSAGFREGLTGQHALACFLRHLERYHTYTAAFAALWDSRQRELTYLAVGFEPPSIINDHWPRLADRTVCRDVGSARQRVAFGEHRFFPGERWLLYTRQLVEVPDPSTQPFNSVGIIQYAYDSLALPSDLWLEHLFDLALAAHGDALPAGALLISVVLPWG